MYIEGPLKSGKTSKLIDKFAEFINAGIPTSEILVICANSYKKKIFIEKTRNILAAKNIKGFGSFPVYTFNGIVYNSILNNWSVIEEIISNINENSVIIPNLCGLETTEYILKLCIDEVNKQEKIENTFKDYASEINLRHQLLRRYRLITENFLDKTDIIKKTNILEENLFVPAQNVLEKLKKKTSRLRSFDYLKQTSTFLYLLTSNKINFKEINWLIADDIDELSYAALFFIKTLLPQVKEAHLAADPKGSSRRGYLCAYPEGWHEIKQLRKDEIQKFSCEKFIFNDADKLFKTIKNNLKADFEYIKIEENAVRRVEMLDAALKKVKKLLNNRVSLEDIKIIAPSIDKSLKYSLIDFFEKENINYQFLTGSKKITEDRFVFGSLVIVRLINENWQLTPKSFEIRTMIAGMVGIPAILCEKIIESYEKNKKLDENDENFDLKFEEFNKKYQNLINFIKEMKQEKFDLYDQLTSIFTRIISPELREDSDFEDFSKMLESLKNFKEILEKFEENEKPKNPEKEWLIQLNNTVVSDNPPSSPKIKPNSILIATPQKIIDFELESKYQIWLDISSSQWTKDDTGPLYNSWVFQKNWKAQKYTPEIHNNLTLNKTAHVLRKLALCADKEILCYASQLDESGNENNGALIKFFGSNENALYNYDFMPRQDQKPVLKYSSGKMAISAVPGAGKTKIIEALVVKLIKDGTRPGEILVLTYMDSAARNFRERIKTACPDLTEFPYITTIHSLARNIIKDNYSKLGLSSDFEISDDEFPNKHSVSKAKLLNISEENIENFLKNKDYDLYKELYEFLTEFKNYNSRLKKSNSVDFDDLLIMAVKLLKNYPEIKDYYQKQYKYVIEDEAQDSSKIQQELISFISEKHENFVRCGDANQTITTTFSNTDVKGFRNFINSAKNSIKMVSSQRCAKEIYELANSFIDWSKTLEYLKEAFLPMKIEPVEGKNPKIKNSVNFKIHETSMEEKKWVLNEFFKLKNQNSSFGILLRQNNSVIEWAEFLEEQKIPCICFTDSLNQKKVFRFLTKYLQVLNNPWNNDFIRNLYKEFIDAKIYESDPVSKDFLAKINASFINFNPTDLPTANLIGLQMYMTHWTEESSVFSPEELILKLGFHYFDNVIDRSNVQLFSILAARFKNKEKSVNLSDIIEYFNKLGERKKISGIKFFDEWEKDGSKFGFVQIMTVHKAKGLEFDAVFMPEMNEDMYSYSITPENIEFTEKDILINRLNQVANNNIRNNKEKLIQEQIEEHLRLIYTGITRAKKYLYMSSALKKISKWGKLTDNQPSKALEHLIEN
ncbi:MAG: ATP-dependent helicase [bacterium]